MKQTFGVVDVGGGMRGIYAAGILDYCLDHAIEFDIGIGVSAGSANLASFIAHQPRRNLQFYTEYAFRKQYMGMGNFLRSGNFVNLDYVYGTLSNANGESPLDCDTLLHTPTDFLVVATDARTGQPVYFDKRNISPDNFDIFKASSAIPFVCKPYPIGDIPCYDGALGDPVPIEKAFACGCDKVVLILTLPVDTEREPGKDLLFARLIRKKYPKAALTLEHRAEHYNASVRRAKEYAKDGRLLILSPDDTCGISTLKRDQNAMRRLYDKGYRDAIKLEAFLAG